MSRLLFTNDMERTVTALVEELRPDRVALLTDANVMSLVLPQLDLHQDCIIIPAGDEAKTLDTATYVWEQMQSLGLTRHSLLINLGGGMVTDLGGFCAATFKRGIRFINIPTTVLGAVDAAVGGKTGINFGGLKNEIGVFRPAEAVIISTTPFSTLPLSEVRSGLAEMLKHGLLDDPQEYGRLLASDGEITLPLLQRSVDVKERIVAEDPTERGLRKALNLGHTAGHAFEELMLERGTPVAHGFAVAHGLLVEMILSHMQLGFPSAELHRFASLLREAYAPAPSISCDDYPHLLELMRHDKKNRADGLINFTLLRAVGEPQIDCTASDTDITAALDIYRDLLL